MPPSPASVCVHVLCLEQTVATIAWLLKNSRDGGGGGGAGVPDFRRRNGSIRLPCDRIEEWQEEEEVTVTVAKIWETLPLAQANPKNKT